MRTTLQRLLVEEENKLAADAELLADVGREIARCQELIEKQRALVSTLDGDGRDVTTASALLKNLTEALSVHRDYNQRVATRLEQNPSYRETRGGV
jgi:phosphoserine phosphatase